MNAKPKTQDSELVATLLEVRSLEAVIEGDASLIAELRADNAALRIALERTINQLEMLRRGDDWAPNSTAHAIETARAALARSA